MTLSRLAWAAFSFSVVFSGSCASNTEVTRTDDGHAAAPVDAGVTTTRADAAPASRTQVIHETLHGIAVSDPYRWLEDEKSPEVQSWMKAQHAYARSHLDALPKRKALKETLTSLSRLDQVGLPEVSGGRLFYTRRGKAQEKSIVVYRDGDKGQEKVALDPNAWSTDSTVSLGSWVPSHDGKKIVFAEHPEQRR